MKERASSSLGVTRLRDLSGQPLRFVIAGGTVAVTYLSLTLVASGPLGVPIQVAIPICYSVSIALHFTLQRFFVFRDHDAFALAMHHQVARYLGAAGVQYAITATATAVLPELLGVNERVVYVVTVVIVALLTFRFLRGSVFHAPESESPTAT